MVPSDHNTRWQLLKQDHSPSKNRMPEIHSFNEILFLRLPRCRVRQSYFLKNIGEIIWHEKRIDKIIQFVHVMIEKHSIYRLLLFRIMTFTKRNYEIGRREER